MSRNLNLPYFPVPPNDYNKDFMDNLVRAFSVYLSQMQNPGEGRNTRLVLTNLPSNDYGLETGALFQQDGFVKIAQINTPHVQGSSATGVVGTVTVVT